MQPLQIVVVGGGAAGFFAAITCAEANPQSSVLVLEQGPQFLAKVRISGGGRCNVTHACFNPRDLSQFYPRGGPALIGPFHRFGPAETVDWFQQRGVSLRTEPDGRMFPVTNTSRTVVDCLLAEARTAGLELRTNCGVTEAHRTREDRFLLQLSDGTSCTCDRLLLATGGCRGASSGHLATAFGHTLEPPVPSLFAFQVPLPWLNALTGLAVESVALSAPGIPGQEVGPLLLTHTGLSGPAVLRLSARGARTLHQLGYCFPLLVRWIPALDDASLASELKTRRRQHAARQVVNAPLPPLPARLWRALVQAAGIAETTRWADLSRPAEHRLLQQLTRTELPVSGKSLNKDEFVTCGGVRLREVDFKTMQSRLRPGLHFAGELLDIDGLTGGFNFQAAWTTGWLAGHSLASPPSR